MGKLSQKGSCIPIRVNDTDRQHEITDTPHKSVYIPYLCLQLFVHMYLLPDSSSISISVCNPVESTGIQSHSAGFHWTPLDSTRMTGFQQEWGGTVKYCNILSSPPSEHAQQFLIALAADVLRNPASFANCP